MFIEFEDFIINSDYICDIEIQKSQGGTWNIALRTSVGSFVGVTKEHFHIEKDAEVRFNELKAILNGV